MIPNSCKTSLMLLPWNPPSQAATIKWPPSTMKSTSFCCSDVDNGFVGLPMTMTAVPESIARALDIDEKPAGPSLSFGSILRRSKNKGSNLRKRSLKPEVLLCVSPRMPEKTQAVAVANTGCSLNEPRETGLFGRSVTSKDRKSPESRYVSESCTGSCGSTVWLSCRLSHLKEK